MKYFLYCVLCAALFATAQAQAAWGDNDFEFDTEAPWQEVAPQLPAYPNMHDALPFQVSAATSNQFFIDSKSLSVGEDGVVRYTLIVKSNNGAMNVSFEGIRCRGRERKIYAFGRPDGTWAENKTANWLPIKPSDPNRQQQVLYDDFFCPGFAIINDAKEAIAALKRGKHPRAEQ